MSSINLKQRPPRSPRARLGGFVILPRLLDKCRAEIAGTHGEYNYACPLDQRFLTYIGVDAEALKEEAKKGLGDQKILEWIQTHARSPRNEVEISGWSYFQEHRAPTSLEEREFFTKVLKSIGPERGDITTWFDLLDLDDFVSFGGKA